MKLYERSEGARGVFRTIPKLVESVSFKKAPRHNYVTGYGAKIPMDYVIRYAGRERRVYVMNYGNSGSLWLNIEGQNVFLDLETQHRLEDVRHTREVA